MNKSFKFYAIKLFDSSDRVVVSSSRMEALKKIRNIFGQVRIQLVYAKQCTVQHKKRIKYLCGSSVSLRAFLTLLFPYVKEI